MSNKNQINQIEAECQKIYEIGQKVGIEQALKAVAAFRKRLEDGDCSCEAKKKYEEFIEEIKETWEQEKCCDSGCKCDDAATAAKKSTQQKQSKRKGTYKETGPYKWRSTGMEWETKPTDPTKVKQCRLPLSNDRVVVIEGENINYYNVERGLASLSRTQRLPMWTWNNLGIKEGTKITSRIDGITQVKVTGNRHVLLNGVEMSLAEATQELGKDNDRYVMPYDSRTYWAYGGVCLAKMSTKFAYAPNRQKTVTQKPSGLDKNSRDFTWAELGISSGSMLEFNYDAEITVTTTGRNKVIMDGTVMTIHEAKLEAEFESGSEVHHNDFIAWTFNGIQLSTLIKHARS